MFNRKTVFVIGAGCSCELGLPAGGDAPLLVDVQTGERLSADAVPLHLCRARLTQVGVEANTSICRGMLQHRYAMKER